MRRIAYVAMPDIDYVSMLCIDVIGLKALGGQAVCLNADDRSCGIQKH